MSLFYDTFTLLLPNFSSRRIYTYSLRNNHFLVFNEKLEYVVVETHQSTSPAYAGKLPEKDGEKYNRIFSTHSHIFEVEDHLLYYYSPADKNVKVWNM